MRSKRPTPADLRLLVDRHGSISAVARELGVSRTSVRTWLADVEVQVDVQVEVPYEAAVELPLPLPPRPPVIIRRQLPKSPAWYTRVPVWVWQALAGAALVAWAYHGR